MFFAMMFDAFSGLNNEIDIRCSTDGSVFNLRRLQAKINVKTDIINEFLFADNWPRNAAIMQYSIDNFPMASDSFGRAISIKRQKWCIS